MASYSVALDSVKAPKNSAEISSYDAVVARGQCNYSECKKKTNI